MKRILLLVSVLILLLISGCISSGTPSATQPQTSSQPPTSAPDTAPPTTTQPPTTQPPTTQPPDTSMPPSTTSPSIPASTNSISNFPPIDIVTTTEPPVKIDYEYNWTEIGHDTDNSYYTEESFGTPNEEWSWRFNVGEHGNCRAVVYEGRVFVTCRYMFFCLDIETGEKLWDRSVPTAYQGMRSTECTPVVYNGMVYITITEDSPKTQYKKLHCYDCETGTLLWNSELFDFPKGSPTSYDGMIYVPEDNCIECFDPYNGERLPGMYSEKCGTCHSIIIHDDIIYTVGSETLMALDFEGNDLWQAHFNNDVNHENEITGRHGATYYKDHIYASFDTVDEENREKGLFACFSIEAQDLLWTYEDEDAIFCSTSVAYYDKVYFVKSIDMDSYVCCVDAFTGEEIWVGSIFDSFKIDWAFSGDAWPCPIIADDKLYVGNTGDEIFCFDVNSGELLWTKSFSGGRNVMPIVANGKLIITASPIRYFAGGTFVYCYDDI